jgi:hypothetical protein
MYYNLMYIGQIESKISFYICNQSSSYVKVHVSYAYSYLDWQLNVEVDGIPEYIFILASFSLGVK